MSKAGTSFVGDVMPPADPRTEAQRALDRAFRDEWGRAIATLVGTFRDPDLAEECVQDAFTAAAERWRREGIPTNPGAWIVTTARNRALDRLRRARTLERKLPEVHRMMEVTRFDAPEPEREAGTIADERLRLMFTCCHPALATDARIALTLRLLGGLTTGEIARAFLVPEATLAQRLVRAKRKMRDAGIPFRVPPDHLLPERLDALLTTLSLIFNEGYLSTDSPELVRDDLTREAIRLARLLTELMPDEPEALALHALFLLQDSRRVTRRGPDGSLTLLAHQDRTRWDIAQIVEGVGLVERALRHGRPGRFQLQAAIAACHAEAASAEETDWPQILALYGELVRLTGSPIASLNRAVALAEVAGPEAGLEAIAAEALDRRIPEYHLLHATRADMLRRAGRIDEAIAADQTARALATNPTEQAFLERRIATLENLQRETEDRAVP